MRTERWAITGWGVLRGGTTVSPISPADKNRKENHEEEEA